MGLFGNRDEEFDDVAQYKRQQRQSNNINRDDDRFNRTDFGYDDEDFEFDLEHEEHQEDNKNDRKSREQRTTPKEDKKIPEHQFPRTFSETNNKQQLPKPKRTFSIGRFIGTIALIFAMFVLPRIGQFFDDNFATDEEVDYNVEYKMPETSKMDVATFVTQYQNAMLNNVTDSNIADYDIARLEKGVTASGSYSVANDDGESLRCVDEDKEVKYCVKENFTEKEQADSLEDINKYFSKEEITKFSEGYESTSDMVVFINNQSYTRSFCMKVYMAYMMER